MTMSPPDPLVSIVVPVYNGERYVRESLESILSQTYPRIEVVIADNASTDGTPDIVAGYDDSRVRYHRNERNLGLYANVNVGLGLARGDLVAVYHADDVYGPEIVAREVSFLREHADAGAVFALDVFIDSDGREFGRLRLPAEFRRGGLFTHRLLLDGFLRYGNSFLRAQTSMVRREVYDEVGLYEPQLDPRSDLDMWLRIAKRHPIGLLPEYLVRYRWGHANVSHRYDHLRTEPDISFAILDSALGSGGSRLASPDALAAHEGRRAEDLLMTSVNRYIVDGDVHETLRSVSPRRIVGGRTIQRGRLLVLWALLHALARLPKLGVVAALFYRRWHATPEAP